MQSVNGRRGRAIDAAAVAAWSARYRDVIVDLGTGDGRFVLHLAQRCPARGVIGVDTCQANLRRRSRAAPNNALFLVADALALPTGLLRLATRVTVHFPWGSLLIGLVNGHAGLLEGVRTIARAGASLEVTLNAGALADCGWTLEAGGERVATVLAQSGFAVGPVNIVGPDQLRRCPTTWAKRLAYGRDPCAIEIRAALG